MKVHVTVQATSNGGHVVSGVGIKAQMVTGFVQAWMQSFRELCVAVQAIQRREFSRENERVKLLAQELPISQIMQRQRIDQIAFTDRILTPSKVRKKFST
ncbi:hypothetical protein PO768_28105 [Paucibacter sp. XJ19-41]|nr:hypothetical protein [Paucibacter sp. XJ19-41]